MNNDRTDNRIENLAWATMKEQVNYGGCKERAAKSRMKPIRCVETGEEFESIKAAAAALYINYINLSKTLRGKQKTCQGYHWEYVEKN